MQPPNEPTEAEIAKYTPRYNFARELNFEDQWRGQWVEEDELPENAPVNFAYAVVMRENRGYVTRNIGDEPWQTVETAVEIEDDSEAMIKEAVLQQTGASASHVFLNGFFECKATRHNTDFEIGTVRVRALYTVAAGKIDDVPEGSNYQRRRLPVNEFTRALKQRYPELVPYWRKAVDLYLVKEQQGEL